MIETVLLRDLSVVMVVAAAATLACRALRLPTIIGYLLAGLLIGPHLSPFALIRDLTSIQTLAELGIVFLIFTIGLEFNLPKLRRVGPAAGSAMVVEVAAMVLVGYALGRWLGWSRPDSVFLGAIISISSTSILAKMLIDQKALREPWGQMAMGIAIMEDLAAIVLLTLLSGLAAGEGLQGAAALLAILKVGLFTMVFLLAGLAIVPRLIRRVGRSGSREMLGISAVGLCLASALVAQQLGFPTILGAFLMGSILGISQEIETIEEWIHPIRDLFTAIFFVSAGILLQPQLIRENVFLILGLTALTLFGKTFFVALGSFLTGQPIPEAIKIGLSLSRLGEISFIFGAMALRSRNISDNLYPLAVAVCSLTTLATPLAARLGDPLARLLTQGLPGTLCRRLDRYQTWVHEVRPASSGATILSRYLFRLAIYLAALAAGLFVCQAVGTVLVLGPDTTAIPTLILFWSVSFLVAVPLILAIAYYLNHFLLLAVTELTVRLQASHLLQYFPIQRTYNVIEAALIFLIALGFFGSASPFIREPAILIGLAFGIPSLAFLFRRPYRRAYLKVEEFLDQLLGLATSEPLRAAALQNEGPEGILKEAMERILLERRSPAAHKTLRDVGLREKTGASLIAIYRRGKLRANPRPDMVLLPNDILVVLGEDKERAHARLLLKA